jgi:hypothetical protein
MLFKLFLSCHNIVPHDITEHVLQSFELIAANARKIVSKYARFVQPSQDLVIHLRS